jgi:hypothetical protein
MSQGSNVSGKVWRFTFAAGFIGVVAGIIYSGPKFGEWSMLSAIGVPIASGGVGAALGAALAYLTVSRSNEAVPGDLDGPTDPRPFISNDGFADNGHSSDWGHGDGH